MGSFHPLILLFRFLEKLEILFVISLVLSSCYSAITWGGGGDADPAVTVFAVFSMLSVCVFYQSFSCCMASVLECPLCCMAENAMLAKLISCCGVDVFPAIHCRTSNLCGVLLLDAGTKKRSPFPSRFQRSVSHAIDRQELPRYQG